MIFLCQSDEHVTEKDTSAVLNRRRIRKGSATFVLFRCYYKRKRASCRIGGQQLMAAEFVDIDSTIPAFNEWDDNEHLRGCLMEKRRRRLICLQRKIRQNCLKYCK